jgi:hypothetical protein
VNLTGVTGPAAIGDASGVGTITNDDVSPASITISDLAASEGYTATGTMKFLVQLSIPAPGPISVDYVTSDGTATAGTDYVFKSGQVSFTAGERSRFIEITVNGDQVEELNETFMVTLSNPVGASLARSVATGTILNDDEASIRVTDAKSWDWTASRFGEGTGDGTADMRFTIWTSKVLSDRDIYVDYTTVAGTATSGTDYTAVSGTAMIRRGEAVAQVIVPVTRDATVEPDETMILRISNPIGASIYKTDGAGTIVADDGLAVSIADKSLTEGSAGTTAMTFTLSLNATPTGPVTVDWTTADGTATAPEDYTTANGQVTFGVGETTKTVSVPVVGDLIGEPYETFVVRLSNATGGIVGDGEATGTIVNTDGISAQFRLMFHNTADNHLYRWHFKKEGAALPALDTFNWVTPWGPDADWAIGTVADFDRDGNLDYLWHNYTTGGLLIWYIDSDNLKGFKFPLNYSMGNLVAGGHHHGRGWGRRAGRRLLQRDERRGSVWCCATTASCLSQLRHRHHAQRVMAGRGRERCRWGRSRGPDPVQLVHRGDPGVEADGGERDRDSRLCGCPDHAVAIPPGLGAG